MRGLILGCILLGVVLSMGCVDQIFPQEQPEEPAPEVPNPAAENCADKGYGYKIETGASGEYGVCTYQGEECDEWDLYRGDCCFQDSDCQCSAGETAKCENNECSCIAPEPEENETEPEPEPEPEPKPEETAPEQTNKTVGELVDEGLSKVNSEFYKENPNGNFKVETYTWVIGSSDIRPDELPVGGTGDVAVRFNGDKDPSLKGFGFKSYTPYEDDEPVEDSLVESRAVGVFSSQFPMIHIYETNGMTLKIDYYPFGKSLYGCVIDDKQEYLSGDTYVTLYYFYCVDTGPLVTS